MTIDLNLKAEIIPLKSAAGFYIGMHINEINHLIESAYYYNPETNTQYKYANQALARNDGFLCEINPKTNQVDSVTYKNDMIRLVFNPQKILYCIFVFKGYQGKYKSIGIGDSLKQLKASESLYYDDPDEMYYRVDKNEAIIPGLAIVAPEEPDIDIDYEYGLEGNIIGFCVHDWSLD